MANRIGWCDETLNPIIGCSPCSPGCQNCYAARMATRLAHNPMAPQYQGLAEGGKWTGELRFVPSELVKLRRWKKGRWVFWGSMTDMFHEAVETRWIDECLDWAHSFPRHQHLWLTKRPENIKRKLYEVSMNHPCRELGGGDFVANLHIGVTVCNQEEADAKIPALLRAWPGKCFVSIEPMLGPVELPYEWIGNCRCDETEPCTCFSHKLSWVICGGENGPGARPCNSEWVWGLYRQCQTANIPFWWKGQGSYAEEAGNICMCDEHKAMREAIGKAVFMNDLPQERPGV